MPFTLTMPKLSPTMEGGTIVKWHKKEGDQVKEGDVLFEVATDKATVEHNALDEGFLRKILISEGSDANVNQPVAIFTETKDESIKGYKPEGVSAEPSPEEAPTKEEKKKAPAKTPAMAGAMAQPAIAPEPALVDYQFEWPTGPASSRIPASPLAKKIAQEQGVDLSTLRGSGPGGRVMSRDLPRGQKGPTATFGQRTQPDIPPGTFEEEALTPMRKAIGDRLQASKTFVPHFYVQQEINATPLFEARTQLKNNGVKVTFNDFIVRACALNLQNHPEINSGFNSANNTLIRFKTIDISIAVTIENGLITPIVRHANYKNLGQLSSEVKELASRAKEGKLEPHEYRGGSFTISNLGMYGIHDFQAVINPPQAAILAIGGIQDKPIVQNEKVIPGKTLLLSLSVDHRVIDGAEAALFMKELKNLLENPAILLL